MSKCITVNSKYSWIPMMGGPDPHEGQSHHGKHHQADDKDVESMKKDIQKLYDNQVDQSKVLNDAISITNISRGLINENILKINQIVSTITFLNETIDSIMNQLKPLITARKFLFLYRVFNTPL